MCSLKVYWPIGKNQTLSMDGHTPEYNFTYSGIGVEEIQTFKDSRSLSHPDYLWKKYWRCTSSEKNSKSIHNKGNEHISDDLRNK